MGEGVRVDVLTSFVGPQNTIQKTSGQFLTPHPHFFFANSLMYSFQENLLKT